MKNKMNIKKVLLLNPPIRHEQIYGIYAEWGCNALPVGMAYIAAVLRENDYEVSILDAEALGYSIDETVDAILKEKPDIVGIACKTLWIVSAHKVAARIKELAPEIPVVAGGNHVTAMPERTCREFPSFDTLVIGEGEITFLELIKALNNGSDLGSVNGICYKNGDGICVTPPRQRIQNLDELPMPAWDLLPDLKKYYRPSLLHIDRMPAFTLVTTRGCPMRCTFCDRSVFGRKVTTHSPQHIVNMIQHLHDKYGIKYIVFDDDDLLINRKHLYELLDLLKASKMDIKFTCATRVDRVDEEVAQRLKDGGCQMVLLGVESGSQMLLDSMQKDIKVEDSRKASRILRQAGLRTEAFIVIGYPGETEETLKETVNLIKECDFTDVGVWLFTPLPGSEIYSNIDTEGTFFEDWEKMNSIDGVVFVPESLTEKKLMEYSDLCYRACYLKLGKLLTLYKRFYTTAHAKAICKSSYKMLFA